MVIGWQEPSGIYELNQVIWVQLGGNQLGGAV
jgi:hypothetical protein